MKVTNNSVVAIDYIIKDVDGNLIESTYDTKKPMIFIQGLKNIIYGLEESMYNKNIGDKFTVEVKPEDAYGEYNHKLVAKLPMTAFDLSLGLSLGQTFESNINGDIGLYKVIEVNQDNVLVDGNHPLAGVTLLFDVEVIDIREATAEELENKFPKNFEV